MLSAFRLPDFLPSPGGAVCGVNKENRACGQRKRRFSLPSASLKRQKRHMSTVELTYAARHGFLPSYWYCRSPFIIEASGPASDRHEYIFRNGYICSDLPLGHDIRLGIARPRGIPAQKDKDGFADTDFCLLQVLSFHRLLRILFVQSQRP